MFGLATSNQALGPLRSLGSRAVRATLTPFGDVAASAAEAGLDLQRRALERIADSPELEKLASAALDSRRAQTMVAKALESNGAKQLVDTFLESSLFEEVITRLLESRMLWVLVEEIADSPAVTAAITGQGLGFADQVGEQVRARSRRSDDWLERKARRLSRGHATGSKLTSNEGQPHGARP